jgi:hypothetical protein
MENKFTVEFYEKENGEKPCLLFLNTLEVKLRAKAFRDLKLLEEKGTELRLPYSEQAKEYRKDYLAKHPQKEDNK